MGHPVRIDAPGTWHHVMNRGSGRRVVFRDDVDRSIFLELLSEIPDRFGIEIHAFCLMGNHFHLLVRSTDARLSEAMQWLSSGFTRRVNDRRAVDGPVFRGRFHSVVVTRSAHAKHLIRYIHANPRDLGWDGPLDSYPWSSLGQFTGVRDAVAWLDQRTVLHWFDHDRRRLEAFVEGEEPDLSDVGTPAANPTSAGIDEVVDAVALARSLVTPTPRVDAARLAAMLVAAEAVTLPHDRIADHFEIRPASLRSGLSRARKRRATDPGFARMVDVASGLLRRNVALRV